MSGGLLKCNHAMKCHWITIFVVLNWLYLVFKNWSYHVVRLQSTPVHTFLWAASIKKNSVLSSEKCTVSVKTVNYLWEGLHTFLKRHTDNESLDPPPLPSPLWLTLALGSLLIPETLNTQSCSPLSLLLPPLPFPCCKQNGLSTHLGKQQTSVTEIYWQCSVYFILLSWQHWWG